jgi:hypothetical protein
VTSAVEPRTGTEPLDAGLSVVLVPIDQDHSGLLRTVPIRFGLGFRLRWRRRFTRDRWTWLGFVYRRSAGHVSGSGSNGLRPGDASLQTGHTLRETVVGRRIGERLGYGFNGAPDGLGDSLGYAYYLLGRFGLRASDDGSYLPSVDGFRLWGRSW